MTSPSPSTPSSSRPSSPAGTFPNPGLDAALEQVGDRWSLLIIDALLGGPLRFGELAAALPGIAANVLTGRLRRLARTGLVETRPYQRRPLRVDYALTDSGRALTDTVALLSAWGTGREGAASAAPAHDLCGTPLEVVWWCPTCQRGLSREETREELHHL